MKSTPNQVGLLKNFWTLSCAESHWPECNSLFRNIRSESDYRENVVIYLHIPDLFFHETVEKFSNHTLYKMLGAEGYWNGYDFSVF